ncbi:hypothetical protein [Thiosocius teredinicola]|uniref:hypothetical protein n=1 Tax=Thiosocius teredinicola TaxID=1973002 RepID=UPI0013DDEA12
MVVLHAFSISCLASNSGVAELQHDENAPSPIHCESVDSHVFMVWKSAGTQKKVMVSGVESCASISDYVADQEESGCWYIIVEPDVIGLNAHSRVYYYCVGSRGITPIGDLPIAAEPSGSFGEYKEIYQERGSIWLNRYLLTPNRVELGESSIEMVIDGDICVDDCNDPWDLSVADGRTCHSSIKASYESPVCIVHKRNTASLGRQGECDFLRSNVENWSKD